MGIGDWGLGIGDWGLGIGPNPQSPIPNPQSPKYFLKSNIQKYYCFIYLIKENKKLENILIYLILFLILNKL